MLQAGKTQFVICLFFSTHPTGRPAAVSITAKTPVTFLWFMVIKDGQFHSHFTFGFYSPLSH
jgi:hypothetical protein